MDLHDVIIRRPLSTRYDDHMRCVDGQLEQTIIGAVENLDVIDQDEPVIHLAITYARLIDGNPAYAAKVGPMLLAALESLLMTPRARAAIVRGANSDKRKTRSPLDELRARRTARSG